MTSHLCWDITPNQNLLVNDHGMNFRCDSNHLAFMVKKKKQISLCKTMSVNSLLLFTCWRVHNSLNKCQECIKPFCNKLRVWVPMTYAYAAHFWQKWNEFCINWNKLVSWDDIPYLGTVNVTIAHQMADHVHIEKRIVINTIIKRNSKYLKHYIKPKIWQLLLYQTVATRKTLNVQHIYA